MIGKTLKFSLALVSLVKSGKKICTWRLWDDKDLQEGDEVVLIARPALQPFGKAVITSLSKKQMKQLTQEDKDGHEPFESDEQMYKTYSQYYSRLVTPETPVTVIKFQLK